MLINTAIYVRVSTEEQATEGFSIHAQKDKLTKYAEVSDYNIVDYYIDDGISGKNLNERPEVTRLINDVKSGKINNVLVYKLDGTFIGETASGLISADQKTYKMEDSVIYKSPKCVSSGFAKSHLKYKSMVLMLGANDGIQLITGNTNAYMATIKDMVEHYGGNQYLILGVPNTQYGYGNDLLKKEYGARYFDTIEYMSQYAIYEAIDQGILTEDVLTEEVLSEIEAVKIPSPLRSDWIHMNALGYTLLGNKVAEKFIALGYQP